MLLTVTATAAHAVDFVSDSIKGLSAEGLYVDSSATLNDSNKIATAFSGEPVGVAVLPEMATSTFNANSIASQILNGTSGQYETVIVVIDSRTDSFGVASNGDSVQIATALNEANDGDAGPALVNAAEVIVDATSSTFGTSTETNTNSDSGGISTVAVTGGAILAVALFGVVGVRMLKRRPKKATRPIMDQNLSSLPEDLRRVTEKFRSLYAMHQERGNTELAKDTGAIVKNLQELFSRLTRKGTDQQKRMASVQYVDTLTKLNSALGEDYYLDIQEHPELWNNSDQRRREVEQAVKATLSELVTNIRNFNESRDLEFKVALESLTRSVNDTSVTDLYDNPNS